jgi:hypothetical protein
MTDRQTPSARHNASTSCASRQSRSPTRHSATMSLSTACHSARAPVMDLFAHIGGPFIVSGAAGAALYSVRRAPPFVRCAGYASTWFPAGHTFTMSAQTMSAGYVSRLHMWPGVLVITKTQEIEGIIDGMTGSSGHAQRVIQ